MHIRDRLRATLARRRASHVCWSCLYFPIPRSRSLQVAATPEPFEPYDASKLPGRESSTRLIRRLANPRKSTANPGNGPIRWVSSPDIKPNSTLLGRVRWIASKDVGPHSTLLKIGDGESTPRSATRQTPLPLGANGADEGKVTPVQTNKHPYPEIRIRRYTLAPECRIGTQADHLLRSTTSLGEDHLLPKSDGTMQYTVSSSTDVRAAAKKEIFEGYAQHVAGPSPKQSSHDLGISSTIPKDRRSEVNIRITKVPVSPKVSSGSPTIVHKTEQATRFGAKRRKRLLLRESSVPHIRYIHGSSTISKDGRSEVDIRITKVLSTRIRYIHGAIAHETEQATRFGAKRRKRKLLRESSVPHIRDISKAPTSRRSRNRSGVPSEKPALRTRVCSDGNNVQHRSPLRKSAWSGVWVRGTDRYKSMPVVERRRLDSGACLVRYLLTTKWGKNFSATRASMESATSNSDNVPVFVGRQRYRRYVIRDAGGGEAHIQYTGSGDPTAATYESSEKRHSQADPDEQLLEETEDLLRTWLQVPAPQRHKSPSQDRPPPLCFPSSLNEPAVESGPMAGSLSPAPASEYSQSITDTERHSRDLVYAPSPDTAVLQFKQKLASRRISNPGFNGHLVSAPTHIAARRLHTSTAIKSPLESRSTLGPGRDTSPALPTIGKVGIREHLRLWQELEDKEHSKTSATNSQSSNDQIPLVIRPGEDDTSSIIETNDIASGDYLGAHQDTGVDEDGDKDDQQFLRSGDVVEFGTKTEAMLAIFIRNVGNQAQFYNVQGKWFHRPMRKVYHVIPKMFSLEEIEPILPYLPTSEIDDHALDQFHNMDASIPRSIGAGLLKTLQAFHRASADVYREYSERIDRMHSLVAHEWQRREMSLQQLASIVLEKPDVGDLTEAMLYALHKVLFKDLRFKPQIMGKIRTYLIWNVNPLNQIRDYEKVRQWLREYQENVIVEATVSGSSSASKLQNKDTAGLSPVARFIGKARKLIQKSRVHRKVTPYSSIGPRPRPETPESTDTDALITVSTLTTFDPEERLIIDYLKDWALAMNIPPLGSTWSLSSMLLRAVGMYEGHELNVATGSLLLRELGIIAPWENDSPYSPALRLPSARDPLATHLEEEASRSASMVVSKDGHFDDTLEGLRKDWGTMNVYCIDSASAVEIDDGISVEEIDGQDSLFWIHIHIASPAAFIEPESAIANHAASLIETHYLPEKVYPMLNPKMTQRYFSLANDRPVLTLSARITVDGEIQSTKVTPGWVRKVRRITPDRIRQELGLSTYARPQVSHLLTVGQPVVSKKLNHQIVEETPMSPSEISELRLLRQLGLARRLKRRRSKKTFTPQVPFPHVYTQPNGMMPTFSNSCGRQFIGDPTISWEAREYSLTDEPPEDEADNFVADFMIIAGEIAARWCGQRNIPIPYRGTHRNPSLATTAAAYEAQVLKPVVEEMGYIPLPYRKNHHLLVGTTALQSSPFPHALMETDAYTKATSPLRRYPDMLVHWQMQAALRHESQHGEGSLIGSTDDSYLPFSRAAMDALLPIITMRERSHAVAVSWSSNHWIMQLLHRAFEYKQAPLPAVFDVLVTTEKGLPTRGGEWTTVAIKQLSGLSANILENDISKRAGGFRLGDWWQTRIEAVPTFRGRLTMVPIRLTQRVSENILAKYQLSPDYRLYQS